jgi:hypothetical protein
LHCESLVQPVQTWAVQSSPRFAPEQSADVLQLPASRAASGPASLLESAPESEPPELEELLESLESAPESDPPLELEELLASSPESDAPLELELDELLESALSASSPASAPPLLLLLPLLLLPAALLLLPPLLVLPLPLEVASPPPSSPLTGLVPEEPPHPLMFAANTKPATEPTTSQLRKRSDVRI